MVNSGIDVKRNVVDKRSSAGKAAEEGNKLMSLDVPSMEKLVG